jgi:hypothetical protein
MDNVTLIRLVAGLAALFTLLVPVGVVIGVLIYFNKKNKGQPPRM